MKFWQVVVIGNLFIVCSIAGCGADRKTAATPAAPSPAGSGKIRGSNSSTSPPKLPMATKKTPATPRPSSSSDPSKPPTKEKRQLSDLLSNVPNQQPAVRPLPTLPTIDDAEVNSLGIRKISGTHLILYTDLPANPAIEELPRVFDFAVPQWCEYFAVPEGSANSWKVVGYLIQDKERFRRARLIPDDLPEFLNGYTRDSEIWWYEQPSDYYRRHLMLHEGTHAFMTWRLGGGGPPWYMEGTAELLSTHRWNDGQLSLRQFPSDKAQVPEWGRIKIIKDDLRANRAKSLMEILQYDTRAHLQVEPYGWCWAAAAFLENHPAYQQRFRKLREYARDHQESFSERFLGWFQDDAQKLWREWQWYIVNLDYGYDVRREAIEQKPVSLLPSTGTQIEIASDRGWQSAGVQLEADQDYRVTASGRYQIATQPKIWWSEPNGVTIRYHRGQPRGMLLAAIVDESDLKAKDNGFLTPIPVGLEADIRPTHAGTLYLRVNDSPSELADNQGVVKVQVVGK